MTSFRGFRATCPWSCSSPGYLFKWDKHTCVHLSMYVCVWMHGRAWNCRSRHAISLKSYEVLIRTSGSHSPTWAPQESPSRWNKGKQRFLSPGEPETDAIHEWMGRAVPAPLHLHPCLLHLGAGLGRGAQPAGHVAQPCHCLEHCGH